MINFHPERHQVPYKTNFTKNLSNKGNNNNKTKMNCINNINNIDLNKTHPKQNQFFDLIHKRATQTLITNKIKITIEKLSSAAGFPQSKNRKTKINNF